MFRVIFSVVLLLSVGQAWGASITVNDAGFEDNELNDGGSAGFTDYWIGNGVAYNPTTAQYAGEAPEGENIAAINSGDLYQRISSPIVAGLTYTLEVEVGYRLDLLPPPPNPNFTVELRYYTGIVGGSPLASKSLADGAPANGAFIPVSVSFTAQEGADYIGRDILIYLTSGGVQTNFDDVRLSAVPVPAAAWLFGSALLGLGILQRRKV